MAKVTPEIIEKINLAYLQCKTYAGAARAVGVSPSTAKKYVIPNYTPSKVDMDYTYIVAKPITEISPFITYSSIYNATELTEEEKILMEDFWKEINI